MNIKIKQININTAKIEFDEDDYLALGQIRDEYSIEEINHTYVRNCKALRRPVNDAKKYRRIHVINGRGEFEIGLLLNILQTCKDKFYMNTIKFNLDDKIKNYINTNKFELDSNVYIPDKFNSEITYNPYPYQIESMKKALLYGNGTYILGTGAGKTVCLAILIHNLLKHQMAKKILVICPFPDLANQTYNDLNIHLSKYDYQATRWFEKYKFNKTYKKSGKNLYEFNQDAEIIVGASMLIIEEYEKYKDIINQYDAVIIDEVQQLKKSNKISSVVKSIPAKHKFGFTGTLPDNKLDKWSVIGKVGPIRYTKEASELRAESFLTDVSCTIFQINCKPSDNKLNYIEETEWLSTNDEFNKNVCTIAGKFNKNTLIMYSRTAHGDKLFELCTEMFKDKRVRMIKGGVDLDERSDIKDEMEKYDNVILIANVKTFSTGINVKNLHNIVFSGTLGKSNVQIVQSIGRAVRKHKNKDIAKIIDIVPMSKYAYRHLEDRIKIYTNEKINYKIYNLKNK